MNAALLAPGEPLSPELVLVLPPELRAQVVARLPAPAWAQLRPRALPISPADDPVAPTLVRLLVARAGLLAGVFVAITILTLALSFVAQALR